VPVSVECDYIAGLPGLRDDVVSVWGRPNPQDPFRRREGSGAPLPRPTWRVGCGVGGRSNRGAASLTVLVRFEGRESPEAG
jgi:hypothetical protein